MAMQDMQLAHHECGDCPIRHRAVCARCEADELTRLEQIKYYRSYQAGQTVVWSGDRMDFVASVVTGIATLTQTMEDGRRQMVGLLLPSDFVGRPGRANAAYDVTATTDLELAVCTAPRLKGGLPAPWFARSVAAETAFVGHRCA
mgnify:CR=1 FL=1